MHWCELFLLTSKAVHIGDQAREFLTKSGDVRVDDRFEDIVVLKDDEGRPVARSAGITKLLEQKIKGCRVQRRAASDAASKGGKVASRGKPNVVVQEAGLKMYLDQNRDGQIRGEDLGQPADNDKWVWGETGPGAIITVPNRIYRAGEKVEERAPILFQWEGEYCESWKVTLVVDRPERVRIYDGKGKSTGDREGAELLIGPGKKECVIGKKATLASRIAETEFGNLWIEAADFPESGDDEEWEVAILLKFEAEECRPWEQVAVVRIAPWIMAGDLEPTRVVFARAPEGDACIAAKIRDFAGAAGCDFQPVPPAKKGFMRDAIKAGYAIAPAAEPVCRRVVLDYLDVAANLRYYTAAPKGRRQLNLGDAADVADVALVTRPARLAEIPEEAARGPKRTSQDNGGNYLVAPPSEKFPFGRIVFGEGKQAGLCNLGDFLCAQRLQEPVVVDPMWLSVGHVDEIVAFVPDCSDQRGRPARRNWGAYKVLISSSRLAYALMYATACCSTGKHARDPLDDILFRARQAHRSVLRSRTDLRAELRGWFGDVPDVPRGAEAAKAFADYGASNGKPPGGLDGRMLIPERDGLKYKAKDMASFMDDGWQAYLEGAVGDKSLWDCVSDYQRAIDEGCREKLKKGLGLADCDFIDLPVLFFSNTAATADSTNMLVLNSPHERRCRCLIAKPFGPVLRGEYVFEKYIESELGKLGLEIEFASDWKDMHTHEGEIHCGTNQLPAPLPAIRRKWWLSEPPKAVKREKPKARTKKLWARIVFQDEASITPGCEFKKRPEHGEEVEVEVAESWPGDVPAIFFSLRNFGDGHKVTVAKLKDRLPRDAVYDISEPDATVVARVEKRPEEPVPIQQAVPSAPPKPPPAPPPPGPIQPAPPVARPVRIKQRPAQVKHGPCSKCGCVDFRAAAGMAGAIGICKCGHKH
jgi:hypothetical protein